MKIEPKAFLAIEQTMSAAMRAEWDKIASGIVQRLHAAITRKDWTGAQSVANQMTMAGVVRKARPRLEELATSALLFGAHRASGDVKTTIYAKGEPVPHALHHVLDQLEHAVELDAADYIRATVHRAIDNLRRADPTQTMQTSVTKFDPEEPRDGHGEWTAGGGNGNQGTAGTPELRTAAGPEARGLPGQASVSGGAIGVEAQGRPDLTTPLKGLPTKVKLDGKALDIGPYAGARQAAFDYAKSAGLAYHPPTEYVKVDPERATRIATAYDTMKNDPHDPEVKAAYGAMIHECMGQWDAMVKSGLKIEFIPDHAPDPYAKSPRLMTEDVRQNNHMWVFPTNSGFGTDAHFDASENPLLGDAGLVIGSHHLVYNDVFRAVHDFYGHVKEGNGFRADGEENAWRSHSAMFTPLARRALTSETRGQNSWVNYGPFGAVNRTADSEHTHFADQKVGIMPEWTQREGSGLPEDEVVKGDVSAMQLSASGGLLAPEQAGRAGKSLYVHRDLKNPEAFLAWAKAQGFKTTIPVEDLHVTVLYSKSPVDWGTMGGHYDNVIAVGGKRSVHQFNKGAVVLEFQDQDLADRHYDLRNKGATSDFPEYRSHMTITYDAPDDLDLSKVEAFHGPLEFGPEIFQEIKGKGWSPDDMTEELLKWERMLKAEGKDLIAALNHAVLTGGKMAADLGASMTTSRLITLGFLAQAQKMGHDLYQVDEVLDDKTCPVCLYMNGKTFRVPNQIARTVQALSTSDPSGLKSIAPWPGQSEDALDDLYGQDPDEMQGNGYGAPPYHPYCRGMLALVGTVEEGIPLGGPIESLATQEAVSRPSAPAAEIEDEAAPEQAFDADDVESVDEVDDVWQALTDASLVNADPASAVADEEEELGAETLPPGWTREGVSTLGWQRFLVTDPEVFKRVDDAFQAKQFDKAKALVDAWLAAGEAPDAVEKSDQFDGPNAPRKKRRAQSPTGMETDYEDISSDSSSIAFDSGVSNDDAAPLDRD